MLIVKSHTVSCFIFLFFCLVWFLLYQKSYHILFSYHYVAYVSWPFRKNRHNGLTNNFYGAINFHSQYCPDLGSMTHLCPATRTDCFAPTFKFFPVIINVVPPDNGPYFGVKSRTSRDCKN